METVSGGGQDVCAATSDAPAEDMRGQIVGALARAVLAQTDTLAKRLNGSDESDLDKTSKILSDIVKAAQTVLAMQPKEADNAKETDYDAAALRDELAKRLFEVTKAKSAVCAKAVAAKKEATDGSAS